MEETQENTENSSSIIVKEEYLIQEREDQFIEEQNLEKEIIPDSFQCFKCEIIYGNAQSLLHHLVTQHKDLNTENSDFPRLLTLKGDSGYQETLDSKVPPELPVPGTKHFDCEICGAGLKYKKSLTRHLRNIHGQRNTFKCKECSKIFKIKSDFKRHRDMHSDKLLACLICEKTFKKFNSLKAHEKTHSKTTDCECEKCGWKCKSKQGIKGHLLCVHYGKRRHIRLLSQLEPFICARCDSVFWEKSRLIRHLFRNCNRKDSNISNKTLESEWDDETFRRYPWLIKQVNRKTFKCKECGVKLKQKYSLIRHVREVHAKIGSFECKQCQKTFTRISTLERHELTHSNKLPRNEKTFKIKLYKNLNYKSVQKNVPGQFECEMCGAKLRYKHGLLRHLLEIHTRKNNFKCKQCPKSFIRSSALKRHLAVHSDELFPCEICDKSFKSILRLKRHKSIHGPVQKLTCALCSSKMTRKRSLIRHFKNLHIGKNNFKCNQCPKTFSKRDHLESHLEIHSNLLPCEFCNKTFRRVLGLERHIKTHSAFKVFECEKCGLKYKGKRKLRNHILQVHYGKKCHKEQFICPHCDKTFWEERLFKTHIISNCPVLTSIGEGEEICGL